MSRITAGEPTQDRYDVVIAGARAAGASTGMLLARQGLDVLVVDPSEHGSDTLSTHALMRAGVLQLIRWGLMDRLRAAGTPRMTWTTFVYGDEEVTVPIKERDGVDGLYAPRRTVLDPILADAATEAGAEIVRGWAVDDLVRRASGRVAGVVVRGPGGSRRTVAADLVVGADGMHSRVARLVEAPTTASLPHSTATIYGYVPGLDTTGFVWRFRHGAAAGLIPTNGDLVCLYVGMDPQRFRAERPRGLDAIYRDMVEDLSPELGEALAACETPPRLRAFAGTPSHMRQAQGPGWALVGDAGYFKDPLTAHGITDALRDAELLARAVIAGTDEDLAEYQMLRDAVSIGLMETTDAIASLSWSYPELQRLHKQLSREMQAEVEAILAWDGVPAAA